MSLVGSITLSITGNIVVSLLGDEATGPRISLSAPDFGGSTYYEGVDDNDVAVTISNATDGASWDLTISSSGGGTAVTDSGTVSGSTVNAGAQDLTGLNAGTLTFSYEEASVEVATKAATLAVQAAPGAPTITGVTWSSEAATVTISAGSPNGAAITDHIWEYNEDGGGWTEFAAGVSTATSETTPTLSKGASVDFRVRSVNAIDTGDNSATSSSAVPATAPSAVQSLAVSASDGQLAATWTAPSDDGGSPITDYVIGYRLNSVGGAFTPFADGVSSSTGATITGLTNGAAYDVEVYAVNAIDNGASATDLNNTPAATPVPSAVTDLIISRFADNLEITWSNPADNGFAITDYVIQRSVSGGAWVTQSESGGATTWYRDNSPTVGQPNSYRVVGVNSEGQGLVWSNVVTATPEAATGGLLIAKGDSVTSDAGTNDPSYANIGAGRLTYHIDYANRAVGGSRLGDGTEVSGTSWLYQVQTDIIDQFSSVPAGELKIVTVAFGNTFYDQDPSTVANGGDGTAVTYFDAIRRAGIDVVMVDSNPRNDSSYTTRRASVETWGASSDKGLYFDEWISFRGLSEDAGEESATGDTDLFPSGDHIHPLGRAHKIYSEEAYRPDLDAYIAARQADTTAPTIRRLNPADDQLNVAITGLTYTARFDEQVKFRSAVSISLYNSDNTLIESWDETDIGSGIQIYGIDLEITPSVTLAGNKGHYIQIGSTSIEDQAGNAFAGISDATTWSFTTIDALDLTDQLILSWEMDEASGNRTDEVNSRVLTDNATVTRRAGPGSGTLAWAAEFDSANSEYFNTADNDNVGYLGSYTWEVVFYTDSNGAKNIISKGATGFGNREFVLEIEFGSGWNLRAMIYRTGGGNSIVTTSDTVLTGSWHQGILTYDASTQAIQVIVNDGTPATATLAANDHARETGDLYIGAEYGSADFFDGAIAHVRKWNKVLSAAEITALYNAGDFLAYTDL